MDTLKIDRSFVARIQGKDAGEGEIVRLIVSLARTLGIEVVAEGTETEAQVRLPGAPRLRLRAGLLFLAADRGFADWRGEGTESVDLVMW